MMSEAETNLDTHTKIQIKEPPKFKVIYLNDDKTAMEFVVETLMQHFQYTLDHVGQTAANIHQSGAAVVAVLPYEIAEQKGIEITVSARQLGFPLQIKLEPDTAA